MTALSVGLVQSILICMIIIYTKVVMGCRRIFIPISAPDAEKVFPYNGQSSPAAKPSGAVNCYMVI